MTSVYTNVLTYVMTQCNDPHMETTKTPGYNTRLAIFFAADKNGRKVAYRWSPVQMRAFRMNLADAEMFVATESATLLAGHPMKASA